MGNDVALLTTLSEVHATTATVRPRGKGPKTLPSLLLGSRAHLVCLLFLLLFSCDVQMT